MKTTTLCGGLAAILLSSAAMAQQANDVDPNAVPTVGPRALGGLIVGPFDVEAGPFDNRCLGTEAVMLDTGAGLDIHYLVTGAGNTATGVNQQIHLYDKDGAYIISYPQVTNSTLWGGRDMEAISDGQGGYTLYIGSDSAELSEYAMDSAGVITHTTLHTVNGLVGTTRALCTSDGGTTFHTKSFTSPFYTFELATTGAFNVLSSNPVSAPSAYGFGYDPNCGNIWSTDTSTAMTEIDTAGNPTGNGSPGPSFGGAQGGADIYDDPRNPTAGALSMVFLEQTSPDQIWVAEVDACGPAGPQLAATGFAGQVMTFDFSNFEANTQIAVVYGPAGSLTGNAPCGSVTVDLTPLNFPPPTALIFANADANGDAQIVQGVPLAGAGLRVQGVDLTSCNVSNFITIQ
jgi:hypothetical protein